MDILLNSDQRQFREMCRVFAKETLAPIAKKYGETADIPEELLDAMRKAGLFELFLPEELGGKGISALNICLAREALAGVYCAADVTLAMQGLGGYPICMAGTQSQKEKYLAKIGRGELLTTYALTESGAGSDVNAMESEARESAEGFVLNGKKRFISNGHAAHMAVVFAKTPLPDNPRAISAFILEKSMPGFFVRNMLEMIAPHDLVELEFENCLVPRENLLGQIGEGYKIAMRTLEMFRMSVGAAAVGIGQAAFDAALQYAENRIQFGNPIVKYQAIQLKLAEMATELDAARALVYRAAILKDRKDAQVPRAAAMAKFYATEAAFRVVDHAVQIHGGTGVLKGSLVERLYREIRAMRIYEGTSEIQKLIIANSFLKH